MSDKPLGYIEIDSIELIEACKTEKDYREINKMGYIIKIYLDHLSPDV